MDIIINSSKTSKKKPIQSTIIVFLLLMLMAGQAAFGKTIYVKEGASGTGSSWADAYGDLQDALDVADPCDEIWVAAGTYKPTVEVGGSGDRYKTFQMKNAVAIYGGFAGNEPNTFDINDRDLIAYETILSGDLLGNDTPGLDPFDLLDDPNRTDNCYHIFDHSYGLGLEPNAILNGFTITAGNGNGGSGMYNKGNHPTVTNCTFTGNSAKYDGGGMYNLDSSPTVTNCTFSGNSAKAGGGMSNYYDGSPTVTNCTFIGNSADEGGGMYNDGSSSSPIVTNCTFSGNSADRGGGGMVNYNNSSPAVSNCTFTGNSADGGGGMRNYDSSPTVTNCTFTGNSADGGGGMRNYDSSPTVTNCTFTGNSAKYDGGGMSNKVNSSPIVTNCTFIGNSADYNGGGMYNWDGCSPTVTGCTFTGNSAGYDGGGLGNVFSSQTVTNCTFSGNSAGRDGGGMFNLGSSPTVTNCILWGNTATSEGNEIYNYDSISIPFISYCDIAGSGSSSNWDPNLGTDAGGNIDIDPCFVDFGYWDQNGTPADANDDFWVDGDYHLKSEGWRWDSERELWTWDDVTSRCIDAGNPGSPLADEPLTIADDPDNQWGHNLRINMGAYGGTSEASMAPYDWALLCDINNDGTVDLTDLAWFASLWPQSGDELFADFNRDTIVDTNDLELLTNDWLNTTTWY